MTREMRQIRPFQSSYCVVIAENTHLNAWHGARDFARSNDFDNYLTTKNDYLEYGGEYVREHYASNRYFSTPAPIVVPIPENLSSQEDQNGIPNKSMKLDDEIFVE